MAEAPSPSRKVKSEKKHKSSDGKKRKRDLGEDGKRRKSKKHRSEKTVHETEAEEISAEVHPSSKSPFHLQSSTLYLPLAPISQQTPLEGICAEHLSPLILTYYPPFSGVVLSYTSPHFSEKPFDEDGPRTLLYCIDEYAVSWVWVTAEFLLFKPERGSWLEGYVNLENEGHLGLVCWNLFNASIERKRLPKDWRWIGVDKATVAKSKKSRHDEMDYAEDGSGYYVDIKGNKISGIIKFRIKDIESSHDRERGFLSIEGTMLSEDEEHELLDREHASIRNRKDAVGKRLGGSRALGATSLAIPSEISVDTPDGAHKHRLAY